MHDTEKIRLYLLRSLGDPLFTQTAADHFKISRQTIHYHLRKMIDDGLITAEGKTRNRTYSIKSQQILNKRYRITAKLQEDEVWTRDIAPHFGNAKANVRELWNYAFTEIFNNAIDHSEGRSIAVTMERNALAVSIWIIDNGVGIFAKLQKALKLSDERQSVLELAKGKLTTDRKRHSGWGIFFSSRMMDEFDILSGSVFFGHEAGREEDWIMEGRDKQLGTAVYLLLEQDSGRDKEEVLHRFSKPGSFGFDKTVVPVTLAQFGQDQLVSRSQAKRVLGRVELFTHVIFDFKDVRSVGQPFVDEIFRVFANAHPKVKMTAIRARPNVHEVIRTIQRDALREQKAERRQTPMMQRAVVKT